MERGILNFEKGFSLYIMPDNGYKLITFNRVGIQRGFNQGT